MPKESTKATITSFAGTPLVRVVDGSNSRNISPANLVAETGAQAALDGRYAPLPGTVGTAGQVLAIDTADPLVTEWVDGGGSIAQNLWVPASAFIATGGSPATTSFSGRWQAMFFDGTSAETAAAPIVFPSDWATVDIFVYWSNAGAGSGGVRWRTLLDNTAVGATLAASGTNLAATGTAGLQEILVKTTLATDQSITPANIYSSRISRDPTDAADTLTNDAAFLGVEYVRKS